MAKTDHALKRLFVSTRPAELVSWLAGLDVHAITSVPSEHVAAPDPIRSDLVFLVTLTDGRTVLMPIEFQGRRSPRPVPLRVLEYETRMVINDTPDLLLYVVCYVEYGAGRHDTGHHRVASIGTEPALEWNYMVVRLWQIKAEDILALKRPALLPLVALTAMDDPERVIAETVEQLAQVPDQHERETLTIEFQALARDDEIKAMIEHMLRRKNMVFHSPFLEEIREEGYKEGREEGREEGLVEGIGKGREEGLVEGIGKGREEGLVEGIGKGREEGLVEGIGKGREEGLVEGIGKGREEGRVLSVRENILDALTERFNPPAAEYRTIERTLAEITDYTTLRSLFTQVLRAATVDEFTRAVTAQQAR